MKTFRLILTMVLRYAVFVWLTIGAYFEAGAYTAISIGLAFFLFELNYFQKKILVKILEQVWDEIDALGRRIKRK